MKKPQQVKGMKFTHELVFFVHMLFTSIEP